MTRSFTFLIVVAIALTAGTGAAQSSPSRTPMQMMPASNTPSVGDMAPDFTAPWADTAGTKPQPVHLAALRGKVVVLAFFPLDRSSGCTAELTKFRDDYTTIFGREAGQDVVVLPISIDRLSTHTAWAQEAHFPFALVSDSGQLVARLYGSTMTKLPYNARTIFVINRAGKVIYRDLRFGALNEKSYDALQAAVRGAGGMTE